MSKKTTSVNHTISVSGTRKVLTYAYLREAAAFSLEQAEASVTGSFYNCMSSIILSAFCFEAYLNHIGAERIPYWNLIEKKLGPEEKLAILDHELDLRIDYSQRPFQTFKSIIRFRNSLAHGKTALLKVNEIQSLAENERIKFPQTDWEKECTINKAKRYLTDIANMVQHLHERAGYGKSPFGVPSVSSASSTVIQDQ